MLRRTLRRLEQNSTKPYGPHLQHGLTEKFTVRDFRSEKTMTDTIIFPKEQADMRKIYHKLDFQHSKLHAIPRDLGQLPRAYMLRVLYVNQPALQTTLWSLLKENDDCPFDSYRHLDFVLRVALHQNWVVREKNQSDRKWYLSVHPSRSSDVLDIITSEREAQRRAESEQLGLDEKSREEERERTREAVDVAIRDLQHQLAVNVAVLQEQDRELVRDLPYVNGDGSIDYVWYREGGSTALLARTAAERSPPTGDAVGADGDENVDAAPEDEGRAPDEQPASEQADVADANGRPRRK
jgi:hypothetical protein